jgi:hypothetical protein
MFLFSGRVQSISEDEKFFIKFDDGLERSLKQEDLIRVDALVPGFPVSTILNSLI